MPGVDDTRTVCDNLGLLQELCHSSRRGLRIGIRLSLGVVRAFRPIPGSSDSSSHTVVVESDWSRARVCGSLLALLCVVVFLTSGRGTPAPFDPPRELVAAGPYRYVRNPMYVGGIATLLGADLALSSPAILVLAFAAFAIVHLFVVFYEEPALARMFGDDYARYRASVSRWLIRLPKSTRLPGVSDT